IRDQKRARHKHNITRFGKSVHAGSMEGKMHHGQHGNGKRVRKRCTAIAHCSDDRRVRHRCLFPTKLTPLIGAIMLVATVALRGGVLASSNPLELNGGSCLAMA
ncbi:unnamed protein product, partial [Ectocarpus sp. 12 AP-2014]